MTESDASGTIISYLTCCKVLSQDFTALYFIFLFVHCSLKEECSYSFISKNKHKDQILCNIFG